MIMKCKANGLLRASDDFRWMWLCMFVYCHPSIVIAHVRAIFNWRLWCTNARHIEQHWELLLSMKTFKFCLLVSLYCPFCPVFASTNLLMQLQHVCEAKQAARAQKMLSLQRNSKIKRTLCTLSLSSVCCPQRNENGQWDKHTMFISISIDFVPFSLADTFFSPPLCSAFAAIDFFVQLITTPTSILKEEKNQLFLLRIKVDGKLKHFAFRFHEMRTFSA